MKIRASTLNFLNFWGLSNIIFIHPARENQSLNPQLSQLLWIIQFHSSNKNDSLNPQLSQLLWIIQFHPARENQSLNPQLSQLLCHAP